MKPTLHYIHDPLCGWCYGAAPLLRAARDVLPVVAHGGGMMAGSRGSEAFRQQIAPIAARIEHLTGQPFGQPYVDVFLRDSEAVFNSAAPITAMLAIDALATDQRPATFTGLDMLARIQTAQFVEGKHIAELALLADLAAEAGVARDVFIDRYQRTAGSVTDAHIQASRSLLQRVGGHGFPSFVLESQGAYERLDVGRWLGKPDTWREWLAQHTA